MINIRIIPQEAIDLVKYFEGLHRKAYVCPAGYITVGYGHVLSFMKADRLKELKPEVYDTLMATIVQEGEAEGLLRDDLRVSAYGVLKYTKVELTDGQYGALVSFVFNLGITRYKSSTLRMKLNREEYQEAAEEFPKWAFSGGKKLRGLAVRREAEQALFNN